MKKKTLNSFLKNYPTKKFKTGSAIYTPGLIPTNLVYIKHGFIKQSVNSTDKKELIIHIFHKGSIIPLAWGINNIVPQYDYHALTPVTGVIIPKPEFLNFIKKNPAELLSITKRLSAGLDGLSHRITILNFERADKRVSETLKYLSKHFGTELNFTHTFLANFTGLSRERTSIEMQKLRKKGLLSYTHGN